MRNVAQDRAAGAFEGVTIALSIETLDWQACGLGDAAEIETMALATVRATLWHCRLSSDCVTEIAVTLADDATVEDANARWRGKDGPTNILSFPMADLDPGDPPGPLAGDLLLAFETVAREAKAENKPLGDHLRHLLVHGTLHLLGFDHLTDEDADTMEALEIAVLADFKVPDPYLDFVEVAS